MVQTNNSIPAGRQQRIMDFLTVNDSISIKEAAELCNVSEATARRDLDDMALTDLVERTHGGAILHRGTGFEAIHSEKQTVMVLSAPKPVTSVRSIPCSSKYPSSIATYIGA